MRHVPYCNWLEPAYQSVASSASLSPLRGLGSKLVATIYPEWLLSLSLCFES